MLHDGRLLILPLHTLCCGSDAGEDTPQILDIHSAFRMGEGIAIILHVGTGEGTIPSLAPEVV